MKTTFNVSQFSENSFPVFLKRAYAVETQLNETVVTRAYFGLSTARESLDAALDFCEENLDKGLPCRVMFGTEVVADFTQKNG